MGKTVIANRGVVPSAYLNAMNGTNASSGHVHDGVDADGHVPPVDLAAHVTGILPLARQEEHLHDGIERDKIILTGGAHVVGTLPLANVAPIGSGDVTNGSTVTGAKVTDALNTLKTAHDNNIDQSVKTTAIPAFVGVDVGVLSIRDGSILLPSGEFRLPSSSGSLADNGSVTLCGLDVASKSAMVTILAVKDGGACLKIVGACMGSSGTTTYYSKPGDDAASFATADPGSNRIRIDINADNIRLTNLTGSAIYYMAQIQRISWGA